MSKKKITKVLLLNPPAIVKESWAEEMEVFPLGLAYIASVLEAKDFEVTVMDCYIEGFYHRRRIGGSLLRIGLPDEKIVRRVENIKPDLVGISISFSCQLSSALSVSTLLKRTFTDLVTVAGGNHVSAAPGSIPTGTFDWMVMGEGEFRLLNLINSLNHGGQPESHWGIISGSAGNIPAARTGKIQPIKELDSLPSPRFELLPLKKYWHVHRHRRWFNVIATRGCPYGCNFCSIHTIMGRRVRYRSVQNVLDELMFLKKEFSAEQIYFEDDNLTFDMNWAKRLFSEIGRLGLELEIFLRNGIRADRVDSELLELMKKAGVNRVWFSPESGSQRILDQVIQKKMKLEDCENAIRLARKAGLNVTCFFIIGFPQETLEDVRQTLRYAEKLKKMGCDSVWISCATPYPGTELFLDCIRRGIISAEHLDYQSLSTLDSIISNEWFSAGQIKQIRDRAMREMNSKSLADVTRLIRKRVEMLFRNPVLFFRIGFWRAVHAIRKKVIHV